MKGSQFLMRGLYKEEKYPRMGIPEEWGTQIEGMISKEEDNKRRVIFVNRGV